MTRDPANTTLQRVRELMDDGDLVQAYDLLIAHKEQLYVNSLLTDLSQILLRELRSRFWDLGVYPQRHALIADIRSYKLYSHDVYILGLFDGATTVGEALAISPSDELKTLRSIAKLCDLGLLSVQTARH
jgi:hypothetical protein